MNMKKIIFDEGFKEYQIGDDPDRVIRLQLDPNLMQRVEEAMKKTDEWDSKYRKMSPEKLSEADAELRTIFNDAFGTDICTPAFGRASLFTPTNSGKALYEAFFDAFIPELKKDIDALRLTERIDVPGIRPEVQKYMDAPKVTPVAALAKPYGAPMPNLSDMTAEQKKELFAQLASQLT